MRTQCCENEAPSMSEVHVVRRSNIILDSLLCLVSSDESVCYVITDVLPTFRNIEYIIDYPCTSKLHKTFSRATVYI